MLITFFRAIVLYILVLIVMRLMGKREIGQLQPFELAISIMIADLATIPMTETGVPISNGIVAILGLLVMHLIISMLNINSTKMSGTNHKTAPIAANHIRNRFFIVVVQLEKSLC